MSGRLASSWSLGESDARALDARLRAFLDESHARCALLVDRTGQLVLAAGERPDFDVTAFASLAAADFSANDQLASLVGEREFTSLFHQGERESMYLVDVAGRVILVVIFDDRATLGMVRIKVRGAVRELAALLREAFERAATSPLETAWMHEAEDEIDRLFGSQ